MTPEILLVLAIAIVAMTLFMTEALRMDIVALLVLAALALTGLVSPQSAFSGFSNQATVTVGAMFILAAGLQNTGALSGLGSLLGKSRSPTVFLITLFGLLSVISPFINNTAVVAVFIPIAISASLRIGLPPTKTLIPLSYVSQMAGVCTLIGTSTNLLVNSMAQSLGHPGFAMFEFLPLGLACLAAGWIYLLTIGRWILPEHGKGDLDLMQGSGHYVTELHIPGKSKILDSSAEVAQLSKQYGVYVLELWRKDRKLWSPRSETLREGDVLLVRGKWPDLQKLTDELRLEFDAAAGQPGDEKSRDRRIMAEVMIAPNSVATGHRLGALGRGLSAQASILGIQRRGEVIRDQLSNTLLRSGDILLLVMPEPQLARMRTDRNFIILSEQSAPVPKGWRAPFALAAMALVVMLPALGVMPIAVAALLGAVAMVLAGCLSVDEMYENIDWKIVFLMAGLLPLGIAMSETGAAQLIVDHTIGLMHGFSLHIILAVFYLVALLLSELMSNSAAAVLLTPIGISTAQLMGVDATPFLIAITFSAATSFLTPVGYQTNTMVYSAGGYRFTDFVKIGLPLNLIFWVIGTLLIPIFWPFDAP